MGLICVIRVHLRLNVVRILIAICVVAANAQQREDPPYLKSIVAYYSQMDLQSARPSAPALVMNHATGHHGFDIEDDNNRSREILKRTMEFLNAALRN